MEIMDNDTGEGWNNLKYINECIEYNAGVGNSGLNFSGGCNEIKSANYYAIAGLDPEPCLVATAWSGSGRRC